LAPLRLLELQVIFGVEGLTSGVRMKRQDGKACVSGIVVVIIGFVNWV
jgi:hypothetical protein